MRLSDFSQLSLDIPAHAAPVVVTGLSADSRTVAPGDLFVAIPGTKADGGAYIADAAVRGAVAAVAGDTAAVPEGVSIPIVRCADPRRALAALAAHVYAGQPQNVVAVTGTSGKTSVAEFTRQIFAELGHQAASLGTIGVVTPKGAVYGSLTTPDPITLHKTLADMARAGVTHLAMEASSHGLDQHRLDGVRLVAAAFTNLGRDHMDYHPTVEAYLDAKLRLFRELLPATAPVVVNADGARAEDVAAIAGGTGRRVWTVGRAGRDLTAESVITQGFAQKLVLSHAGRTFHVDLPLVGAYQVENALVAAGLALALGASAGDVVPALAKLSGVKGRLEIIGQRNGGLAVVDYAHKPEALTAALEACRPFVTGRLICVFGCGGDRDRGKRAIMGSIAAQTADVVIVTDDNPRSEVPAAIRAEILAAAPGALEIGDRRAAIRHSVAMLQPGDVVVVAGKGHETGQIVGDAVLPFSDHDELKESLDLA